MSEEEKRYAAMGYQDAMLLYKLGFSHVLAAPILSMAMNGLADSKQKEAYFGGIQMGKDSSN